MSIRKLIVIFPALMIFTGAVAAQDQTQDQPKKTIQHVSIKNTSSASGEEMYTSYCAVCHGKDAKGNGPAASALKTPPPDLTQLSKENDGKFPALKVTSAIRGTSNLAAHGSQEMPVWGDLFLSLSNGHESEVQQRVSNLAHYIDTLQAK
jgi:mono/diheme cytochrome c family protein